MEYNGRLKGDGKRIGVVSARFNDFITEKLYEGAKDCLIRHGVESENIDIVRVPGAFEIPYMCDRLAATEKYHVIIALGAIIRGSTAHFDLVASESAKGVAAVSLKRGIPVINGIITTENIEQAIERAGTKAGNKGWDAALAALEMASLADLL